MLDILLESRSHTPRRLGGTIASALLHTALISAAVALAHPTRGGAVAPPHKDKPVIWVVRRGPEPQVRGGRTVSDGPISPRIPTLLPPDVALPDGPAIDLHVPVIDDGVSCFDCRGGSATGGQLTTGVLPGIGTPLGIVDEREVDRVPRLLGRAIEPRYPTALRESGVQGSVVVQFVVDTLGRVDASAVQVIQSPHALFTESVREALARYRFAPGEVAGRRVATRVQIPFEFKLR